MSKDLMQVQALAKTLLHEMAKVMASQQGRDVAEVLKDMNQSTKINLTELIGKS